MTTECLEDKSNEKVKTLEMSKMSKMSNLHHQWHVAS